MDGWVHAHLCCTRLCLGFGFSICLCVPGPLCFPVAFTPAHHRRAEYNQDAGFIFIFCLALRQFLACTTRQKPTRPRTTKPGAWPTTADPALSGGHKPKHSV